MRILLRSRQFTPPAGVEAAVRAPRADGPGTRHVLVQFHQIPTAAEQASLEGRGLRLLNYIPNGAWFAALSRDSAAQLESLPQVRWAGELQPADRLAETLAAGTPLPHSVLPGDKLALEVIYFADVDPAVAGAVIEKHGGAVTSSVPEFHLLTAEVPRAAVAALAQEDILRWIAEVPPTPSAQNDSIRARMRVNEVQAPPYNLNGAGVTIAQWDCGPVAPHPDFGGRLNNVAGQAGDCSDRIHSTHVGGIMAGNGGNSIFWGPNAGQWRGVAPGANLVAFDYYTATTEVQTAINAPYNANIANNSWGYVVGGQPCSTYNNSAPFYDQIVGGLFSGKRVPIVFAAGNMQQPIIGGTNCNAQAGFPGYGTVIPPGTAKNVMTIGATDSTNDAMTSFSSWGPTFPPATDGRIKPDVVAPGYRPNDDAGFTGCTTDYPEGIRSTCPDQGSGYGYGKIYGTSMATPAVSGMYALVLQAYRQTIGQVSALLEPASLKALAVQGAVDLGNPGPDYKFGWGRVDAKNSVDLVRGLRFREGTVSAGTVVTYPVTVLDCDATFKASLAWDDVSGAENAQKALVNDLDLTLIDPVGGNYLPRVLNPLSPNDGATPGVDTRNNVEQVMVSNPPAGRWSVAVRGAVVPVGPQQRFSVAMDGLAPPVITSLSAQSVMPGGQIVIRGRYFERGCSTEPLTVAFGGGATVNVPSSDWTFDTITVTVPAAAESGDVTVGTPGGTSNGVYLRVSRPRAYLPLVLRNFPPPYAWLDASGGTRIVNGDDVIQTIALPFPFPFYGNVYNAVTVSSNGFISFGPLAESYRDSDCIPTAAPPNNAVYAFWNDLVPDDSHPVWAKTVNGLFVIEWQGVPRFSTQEFETFEIVLYPGGGVAVQYQSVSNVLDVVVGTENPTGTAADQRYCHVSEPPTQIGTQPAPGMSVFFPGQ